MKKINNLLLVVDAQHDFCHPQGSLYVPGAEEDMVRLSRFISNNADVLSQIVLTRDEHQVIDISHPAFWRNSNGLVPEPFTTITLSDFESKAWIPVEAPQRVEYYLRKLEEQCEMTHVIWPEHCLAGSLGASFNVDVMNAVVQWARRGRKYEVVSKGQNQFTEHFGALHANVRLNDDPGTQVKPHLLDLLAGAGRIIIAGEAKSHCVAQTLKQILEQPSIKGEIVILEDCMSCVSGFENASQPVYDFALNRGVLFVNSLNYRLK